MLAHYIPAVHLKLATYFLLLLSELDAVFAHEGDGLVSSVNHVVCLHFPYKALGAELDRGMALSCVEVGGVVAARTGRTFSAVGVL